MTITFLINQLVFPVLLFGLFFVIFNLEDLPFKSSKKSASYYDRTVAEPTDLQPQQNLERFYEVVEQDETISSQLNEISDRTEFIRQLIQFGKTLGYTFTTSEVISSIAEHTDNPYGNYICLPIGCFSVNS